MKQGEKTQKKVPSAISIGCDDSDLPYFFGDLGGIQLWDWALGTNYANWEILRILRNVMAQKYLVMDFTIEKGILIFRIVLLLYFLNELCWQQNKLQIAAYIYGSQSNTAID